MGRAEERKGEERKEKIRKKKNVIHLLELIKLIAVCYPIVYIIKSLESLQCKKEQILICYLDSL